MRAAAVVVPTDGDLAFGVPKFKESDPLTKESDPPTPRAYLFTAFAELRDFVGSAAAAGDALVVCIA